MKKFYPVVLLMAALTPCFAQLSPPGLDDTRIALWGAAAINQSLGEKWSIQSYVGASRLSDPDNNRILKKQAIYVVEQQLYRNFNKHWQLAACFSFRGQKRYEELPPYDNADPALRRELRYYLRLFYRHAAGPFSFTYSLRPEWRNFYDPDWKNFHQAPRMLRYRFKVQGSLALDALRKSSFILANEWLFIEPQKRITMGNLEWNPVSWSEDRLTAYYRHVFKKKIALDVGLMEQLNFDHGKFATDVLHFAFDVILIDPLGKINVTKSQ